MVYKMDVDRKQNVAFGSTLDRQMFPTRMPFNRFGNNLTPIRGAPHLGPGCYDNEQFDNLKYDADHYITSDKGYVLGARTAARFRPRYQDCAPAPPTYQTQFTEPKVFDPAFKPFSVGGQRFPVRKNDLEVSPGSGTYDHDVAINRKVQWHSSFGGAPINLPQVQVQSTIQQNTEKLFSTKEEKRYHRRLAYLRLYY